MIVHQAFFSFLYFSMTTPLRRIVCSVQKDCIHIYLFLVTPVVVLFFEDKFLFGKKWFHGPWLALCRNERSTTVSVASRKTVNYALSLPTGGQTWTRRMRMMRSGRRVPRSWLTDAPRTRDPALKRLKVTSGSSKSGSELTLCLLLLCVLLFCCVFPPILFGL